ncbi:MAG: flagellar biosynthesis protein FlhA [Campylobacterales bacterium]
MAQGARGVKLLSQAMPFLRILTQSRDLAVVVGLMMVLAIIIVPLPALLLDFFLAISFALSVLVLLMAIYVPRPVDLSTFPTLILIVTLFRLSLNVATTRMILTNGHEGPEAVSQIIASFGNFVVGGNYVIGVIVFTILVIVNFMVITKGSGRVAEVAARFTLDAMPGKQMAIDADLNAGMIDEQTARARRQEIIAEANFYGAMDGSSKFVSGDAIAGIIITLINIIGGFLIGVFQHDLSLAESAANYTILTIGDGLISQLPALITSTATGIMITRATKEGDSGNFAAQVVDQLLSNARVLLIVGGILAIFALVPGLPHFSLGFVGFSFLILGWLLNKSKEQGSWVAESLKSSAAGQKAPSQAAGARTTASPGGSTQLSSQQPAKTAEQLKQDEEQLLSETLKVEMLELDVGYGLIRLVDTAQGGDLLERIKSIRRKIAADFGFVMPQVRIRDNLHLGPNEYEFLLKGIGIGKGEVYADKFMVMNSGLAVEEIEGIPTKEPAFGLDAWWIEPYQKEDAIIKGYTVIDPATVITTHMSELIKKYAEELITRQDVQELIEKQRKEYPVVVEDVLKVASIGLLQRVIKQLLHEKIPIRDMLSILEAVADVAEYTKNVDVIVEHVRARLSRVITNLYKSPDGTIKLLTFSAASEQKLLDKTKDQNGVRTFLLSVSEINNLVEATSTAARNALERGIAPVVLIVDPLLRKNLADIYERFGLEVVVLSHAEIDPSTKFEVIGVVEF